MERFSEAVTRELSEQLKRLGKTNQDADAAG